MNFFKNVFFHSPIKYIILFLVATGIVLTNLFLNSFTVLYFYVDGFFIAGAALILVGFLSLLNYFGAYDFWSYAFSRKKKDEPRVPIYDFSEEKKRKRKLKPLPFGPYFGVGIVFFVISIILLVIFTNL